MFIKFNPVQFTSVANESMRVNHAAAKTFMQLSMNINTHQLYWMIGKGELKEIARYNDPDIKFVSFITEKITPEKLQYNLEKFLAEYRYKQNTLESKYGR